jgi:hydroxycarboxylate dehydrogenase B
MTIAARGGVVVEPAPLHDAVAAVLEADGAAADNAQSIARLLIDADLSDHPSHGVFRIAEYHRGCRSGHINPIGQPRIIQDGGTTVTVDGDRAFGQIATTFAGDAALERARTHGVCIVALRRCAHVGRLSDHVERIASRGMIGMMLANDSGANPIVAPPCGSDGRLSTNPVAFGIPRAAPPHLVFDMASSTIAYGTLILRDRWTNSAPSEVLQPVGGHKGFGLALLGEVLAGILTGAGWSGAAPGPDYQGVMLFAIDPDRFCGLPVLVDAVEELVAWVKASPPRGAEPVLVPGEAGELARWRNRGGIRIDPITWREMLAVFADTRVAPPPSRQLGVTREETL